MDKQEAKSVLSEYLQQYRAQSYADLTSRIGANDVAEVQGSSGTKYQIEVQIMWDTSRLPGGDVRVMGGIDDGRFWSAFSPLTESFIVNAAGKFVGE